MRCLAFALADTRGTPATLVAVLLEHGEFSQAEASYSFARAVLDDSLSHLPVLLQDP